MHDFFNLSIVISSHATGVVFGHILSDYYLMMSQTSLTAQIHWKKKLPFVVILV